MVLEISKRYSSYIFHLMSVKLDEATLATMVECRLLLFLATGHVLKILWQILTWESMGKPKM